ncbi:MAG: hypothetical protein Tsb009_00620 [Planctomycetaceae bacterium]
MELGDNIGNRAAMKDESEAPIIGLFPRLHGGDIITAIIGEILIKLDVAVDIPPDMDSWDMDHSSITAPLFMVLITVGRSIGGEVVAISATLIPTISVPDITAIMSMGIFDFRITAIVVPGITQASRFSTGIPISPGKQP